MAMKRINKKGGKTLIPEPILAPIDSDPIEVEVVEEPVHDAADGGGYFARHDAEAEDVPPLDETAAVPSEGEDSHGADDALGLYLRQMGAIPLLNREQELALAV